MSAINLGQWRPNELRAGLVEIDAARGQLLLGWRQLRRVRRRQRLISGSAAMDGGSSNTAHSVPPEPTVLDSFEFRSFEKRRRSQCAACRAASLAEASLVAARVC